MPTGIIRSLINIMIDKTLQISLTLLVRGESLAKAGVYEEAEVIVTNPKEKWGKWTQITSNRFKCESGEELTIVKPMVIKSAPVYAEVLQNTLLGYHFIEAAMNRPVKPKRMNQGRWLRSDPGKMAQKWNKMSTENKIEFAVNEYAKSQDCDIKDWELL